MLSKNIFSATENLNSCKAVDYLSYREISECIEMRLRIILRPATSHIQQRSGGDVRKIAAIDGIAHSQSQCSNFNF